jgi:hypothetical protein
MVLSQPCMKEMLVKKDLFAGSQRPLLLWSGTLTVPDVIEVQSVVRSVV